MPSPHSSLETLLKTALLGTGRDTSMPRLERQFQSFGQSEAGTEKALLNAAAALTISERAGQLPQRSPLPAIEVCGPETLPYFSSRSTLLLESCLNSYKEIVPHALVWAAQSGKIAPPSLLPTLLDLGRGSKELRRSIVPILGERGRWLAQLNPDWRNVAAPIDADLEASWQDGEMAARQEALRLKRQQEPGVAREWVETAFKTEGAKERTQWVETLANNLSDEDEPFLESTLDDRSKEVRSAAIDLLERLPNSRLVQRAQAALEPLLQWNAADKVIEVTLPTEWDKSWARDGLDEKGTAYHRIRNLGVKAQWLSQWLQRVPPSHWATVWNISPSELTAGIPKEWRDLLGTTWWEFAKRQNSTEWTLALMGNENLQVSQGYSAFQNISREQADALALLLLQQNQVDLVTNDRFTNLLQFHPGPWSVELARAFLRKIPATMERIQQRQGNAISQQYNWLRYYLPSLADKFPIEVAGEAAAGWPDTEWFRENWEQNVNQFLIRLQLRADLHAEFRPESTR